MEEKFSQGKITPTELSEARIRLTKAKIEKAKILTRALLARIEYLWALGLPLKEVL